MDRTLTTIFLHLFSRAEDGTPAVICDPWDHIHIHSHEADEPGMARAVNACFLALLAGERHPAYEEARTCMTTVQENPAASTLAGFYASGIERIGKEIERVCRNDPAFASHLHDVAAWLLTHGPQRNPEETRDQVWSVFFPQAVGLCTHWDEALQDLRSRRQVRITEHTPSPILDPGKEILFTSNVLLTLPSGPSSPGQGPLREDIFRQCMEAGREPQEYWYDHPIPIGIPPGQNEVLYGLAALDEAIEFERTRGTFSGGRVSCALSVSTTHTGLHPAAKPYLEEELHRMGGLKNIDVHVFTETDTETIIQDILAPLGNHLSDAFTPDGIFEIFGVDGEYGRHYSFLKAVCAFWNVFIDPGVRATFKIDLDQVFPQDVLVAQTGASAFEHLMTPLWGARGTDSRGNPVDLGMIAGALVNERDISTSLFTPDVQRPDCTPALDEYVFHSTLPQALSTRAEMMTRYGKTDLDGRTACLERIHVTGGTTGILVESLMRYRPFTPTFIGRAEDQAYILSVFEGHDARLAYAHKDGLIMRHDKEAFIQDSMDAAFIGKLIGDYTRILYFSSYARLLSRDADSLHALADPFTGCFISKIPLTVVYLRFALKAFSLFSRGEMDTGLEFVRLGAQRIARACDFISNSPSELEQRYRRERAAWNLYYDLLARASRELDTGNPFLMGLRTRAREIVRECRVGN
ncbi:MAG: hypothetical protein ACP5G0_08765 [Desulfomonilia bacterium]